MKILLSGASSFTGYWFGKALVDAGHQVTGTYRRSSANAYEGVAQERVRQFAQFGDQRFECFFGEESFLELIVEGGWDVYCHHVSNVANYRSREFEPLKATAANTHNLPQVIEKLHRSGCQKIVFSGTVLERGEGQGSNDLPPISGYGLSKGLSWEVFLFYCQELGMPLQKFVIPAPFGPLEEPGFTNYLVNCWRLDEVASIHTPAYVRDNIHVDLLALEFARFIANDEATANPSGYVESQGRFALRFAEEFRKRTEWECPVELEHHSRLSEPCIRINHEPAIAEQPTWNESHSWDRIVDYYCAIAKTL